MQVLKLFPTEHEEEDGEVDADEWDAKKGAANFFIKKSSFTGKCKWKGICIHHIPNAVSVPSMAETTPSTPSQGFELRQAKGADYNKRNNIFLGKKIVVFKKVPTSEREQNAIIT